MLLNINLQFTYLAFFLLFQNGLRIFQAFR